MVENKRKVSCLKDERVKGVDVRSHMCVLLHESHKMNMQVQQARRKANSVLIFTPTGWEQE